MPYFHATAVFEARGTSLEEADRAAAAVFRSLHYNRIHYHEHDVTAGGGPYAPSPTLYFSVIAEFDVDAGTEDKAGELTADALEILATDDVQFIAFGLTQGEQRVRPAERAPRVAEEPERRQEARTEDSEADERKGKKRGSRGRGRKRKGDREGDGNHEEQDEATLVQVAEFAEPEYDDVETRVAPVERPLVERPLVERPLVERPLVEVPLEGVTAAVDNVESETQPVAQYLELEEISPPSRSSEAMRVTLALSFRASELGFQPNGSGSVDQDEFLTRAIAAARARHPEIPTEVEPTHAVIVQPWGESILTLTWAYDVPVPSAVEES